MASSIRIKNICELPIISGSKNDTRKNSFRQTATTTTASSYWFYPERGGLQSITKRITFKQIRSCC